MGGFASRHLIQAAQAADRRLPQSGVGSTFTPKKFQDRTCLPCLPIMLIRTLALALVLNVYGVDVRAAPVVLLCSGTLKTVYTGTGYTQKGSTSTDETLSVEIDIAAKTLTIDGDAWPLIGDTSGTMITSLSTTDDATLSLVLNRISGAVSFTYKNRSEMLGMHQHFGGVCKPGQKLF